MHREPTACSHIGKSSPISRRTFLRRLFTLGAGGLLAACGVSRTTTQQTSFAPPATPSILLPSPQPRETAEATPVPELLADFLALSAVLTGFDHLIPGLGRVYLQSLQDSTQFEVTVADLIEQAGIRSDTPPSTIGDLEARGIFENEATRRLVDKITEYWYTGIYDTPEGEQAVATYVDALVWTAISFTKPATICGSPGFWTKPPEMAID